MARDYSDTMVAWKRYADGPYWSGESCLTLGMPWFAPEATRRLIEHYPIFLKKARVVELGCGGSTIFFSHLCESVISVETSVSWAREVRKFPLSNVTIKDWIDQPSVTQLEVLLGYEGKPLFDVALVDGDPSIYSRSVAATVLLPMMKPDAIFITDNYYLPDNLVKEFTVPTDWTHEDFNDKHWHGCGTRISTRGKVR